MNSCYYPFKELLETFLVVERCALLKVAEVEAPSKAPEINEGETLPVDDKCDRDSSRFTSK